MSEATIDYCFLGVERPPLVSAVEYVLGRYRSKVALDLNSVLLVVPGARAGRRLRELLLDAVAGWDGGFVPPEIVTVGQLPELLYRPQQPFASAWIQQQAWAQALRLAAADVRARIMPAAPRTPSGKAGWSPVDWLAAGRVLQRQYRELAAEGVSFENVAREGAKLSNFPERERWHAMARIQALYLDLLDGLGLWDRQTARLVAVRDHECRSDRDVLLLGTTDLNRNLRGMLDQVAPRVTALIFAPPQWRTRFDNHGCVDATAWEQAHISLRAEQIMVVDQPMDQAEAVADKLAEHSCDWSIDEATIGCADERLVRPIQRAVARRGARARWGPGRQLSDSLPSRLLDAISQWLAVDDTASFAAVARHPDVLEWLARQKIARSWLRQLDEYVQDHVPLSVTPTTVRARGRSLGQAITALRELRRPFEGAPATLPVWSQRVAELLRLIYDQRTFDRDAAEDRMTIYGCARIRDFLAEQSSVPSPLAAEYTAEEALRVVLDHLRTMSVPAPSDDQAVEMLGWLELPLDDAPFLIVAGVNEGIVPQSVTGDLFLPDRLRKHLDIDDNRRRYARDAYALSVLLASQRHVYVLLGRHDAEGTPLFPSRLLFAADDNTVAQRWKWYFQQAATSENSLPQVSRSGADDTKFGFTVPRPDQRCETLSRLRVTQFRSYLACPYRFYLEHVLRLNTVTDDVTEFEARQFGNVMHTALDAFGRGPVKDSTDAAEITTALHEALATSIKSICGAAVPAAVRIQIEQMRLRLEAFAHKQAEHARDGWTIEFVEVPAHDVYATIPVPEGEMRITGRIDRVDWHPQTRRRAIWDYKTSELGKDPRRAHMAQGKWIDLQLPLYTNLAAAMNLPGPFMLGYINLSQRLGEIGFVPADWSPQELESAQRQATWVVRQVLRRKFWPPTDPPPNFAEDWEAICLDGVMERKLSPSWESGQMQRELFGRPE